MNRDENAKNPKNSDTKADPKRNPARQQDQQGGKQGQQGGPAGHRDQKQPGQQMDDKSRDKRV